MQTIYASTPHYMRHTGNLVDLAEYRRRLERADAPAAPCHAPEPPAPVQRTRRSRSAHLSPGLLLDYCASAAILVMTVMVAVQFLAL